MKHRLPFFNKVFSKVLFVALLNLCVLGLVLAFIVRVQFRMNPGSFLLGPAQTRILEVAHAVALELDGTPPEAWDQVLARYAQTHGVAFVLFDEDGKRVAGTELQLPREMLERIPRHQPPREDVLPPRPREGAKRAPVPPLFLTTTSNPTRYWAGVRIPVRSDHEDPHPGTLLMMSPSLLASPLFFEVKPWLTIGVAVILVSVVCWFPFIRGVTRSISQMTRAAGQIADGRFEIHVADRRSDEIGLLGDAINRMATRLSGFVNGQKRFLSGIAHELCTPIANIQFGLGNLERNLGEEQQEALADIQEEVQHMSALVNELLSFSRAGMQALDVKPVLVNLADTVKRVLEREASGSASITVSIDDKLNVLADPSYLFRAISNVVRNALRYAGDGPIAIAARSEADGVYLTVADSGPGVPEESLEEIFAPFYRLDPSRSQETGGLGLGLAIVRNCVEACGGTVRCRNRQPSGLEVEMRLVYQSELAPPPPESPPPKPPKPPDEPPES
jgi:two-component system sensor histidine kinase CpxA